MTNDDHEHPDDLAMRLESEQYGRDHAAEFCADHARDMQLLIETYGDGEATEILDKLRELFWAEEWKPRQPGVAEAVAECRRLGQLYRDCAERLGADGHLTAANCDRRASTACDECAGAIQRLVEGGADK